MKILSKPLRLNEQYEIVDAEGSIVIPCIAWSGDYAHEVNQKELGEKIVELLNNEGNVEIEEPKKRGNPAFKKGQENPYK